MSFCRKSFGQLPLLSLAWLAAGLMLFSVASPIRAASAYNQLGYLYLSPQPSAEYSSPQTRFVLVRFKDVSPTAVTNLAQFIQVTGANSGPHTGQTLIATDGRTVIFQMSSDFTPYELVTVALNPGVGSGGGGSVSPYTYQFMISGPMPSPGIVTARGDNPPNETDDKAFDGDTQTKWVDLVVPNGTANFSWIQYTYPGTETHVVTQYALTSATNTPERDPRDWNLYGVDAATNLVLLDTRTGQTFASRSQRNTYTFINYNAYRGYRLQITRVNNSAAATAVQLAELQFIPRAGSILREYWTGIGGTAVTDLTGNANYPNNPSGSSQLGSFEAPVNWADNYGTRVRGFITAPASGSFVFWISSDDNSELWLGTSTNPATKTKIAAVSAWTNSREWNKYSGQKSAAITLTAGQTYYVEALQKEGGGGDNLAVGWALPGQSTSTPSQVIPGEVLTPWAGGASFTGTNSPVASTNGYSTHPSRWKVAQQGPNPPGDNGSGGNSLLGDFALTMPNGVSIPSDFPRINITVNNNPDPDYIFLDNRGGGGNPYNVIFDNNGSPVWYKRMPDERRDMKVQPNGALTMLARDGVNHFNVLDTHYQQIAQYYAVNGYSVDEHELQVLKDGTYLLFGLRSETIDMTRFVGGGNPAASVTEQVIQQFTPSGELIFQWRAWDHFDITDQQSFIDLTSASFDFPHMNAIDIDTDGHILLSSRSTSEMTKINRDSGDIIWRLGGAHNQFTYANDPLNGTRQQHSLRCVGTNHYIALDNGNLHSPSVSRGVEYALDPVAMTATVVWQYPPNPSSSLYTYYMGNVQRLTNGNTLINWALGSLPKLTEVRPDGTKAFEMNWADQWEAYRVWRCPWQGVALAPYLILEPYPDNLTLIFNQFGDTNVAYYRIYAGPTPSPTNLLTTSGTTMKRLSNLKNGQLYYFRVTAVNNQGVEGQFSNEENTTINIIKPGQDMMVNGDFAQGTNSWTWSLSGGATASWAIESGVTHIYITNGTATLANIQLKQTGKPLVQGNKYVFEFDAWSTQPRYIQAMVAQTNSPYQNYSASSSTYLTPVHNHYRYVFTMTAATDLYAGVFFNLGSSAYGVYIDNVSLFNPVPGDLNYDKKVDYADLKLLTSQWLQQGTGLLGDLNGDGRVDFKDYAIFGENWTGGN
jgi:hypothetical protein